MRAPYTHVNGDNYLGAGNVALRIEYFSNGEKVMAVVCPKWLEEAKKDALKGLAVYSADTARILDMSESANVVAIVKRDA